MPRGELVFPDKAYGVPDVRVRISRWIRRAQDPWGSLKKIFRELSQENYGAITLIYCYYFPNKPLLNICFALRAQKLEWKIGPKQNGTSSSILPWDLKRNINLQALYLQRMGIKALLGHLLIERLWASYFSSLNHPCGCSPGKTKWE